VLKTKLSLEVMFGLLLAAAAAVPGRGTLEIALSVASKLDDSESGSFALKYVPWPLTAACQRSSIVVLAADTGAGQLHTPVDCHEQTPCVGSADVPLNTS